MEDCQWEVGCELRVPEDWKPRKLPSPVWMCCLRLPPIFAVSELALFLHAICNVPLLPHPVEAAVEPAANSSIHYGSVASTSHHAVELHPWQPVCLSVVAAEEDWDACL